MAALPRTADHVAVLDRTKEPGAIGEPLYLDVVASLREAQQAHIDRFHREITVIGGRYGLGSKDFTPAMVKAVYDELAKARPKRHFTVGINDDVTHLSLPYDADFDAEAGEVVPALFYGLGADGTVGANKNSIKIIGEDTPNFAPGLLRLRLQEVGLHHHLATCASARGPSAPPTSIRKANFVACHQFGFLEKYDVLEAAVPGATVLLNSVHGPDEVWDHLPAEVQKRDPGQGLEVLRHRRLQGGARDRHGRCASTPSCRPASSRSRACCPARRPSRRSRSPSRRPTARKGAEVVKKNFAAVDDTLAHLHEVKVPGDRSPAKPRPPPVSEMAPDFVKRVTALMLAGQGDRLRSRPSRSTGPGPPAPSKWEKRAIALDVPRGTRRSASSATSARSSVRTPPSAPRSTEPTALRGPRGLPVARLQVAETKGQKYTIAARAR